METLTKMLKLLAFAVFLCSSSLVKGEVVTGHLAPTELFSVSWTANLDNETAIFTVSAEGLGYVGFGLSPNGGMAGADIVLGGVNDGGSTYFSVSFSVLLNFCHIIYNVTKIGLWDYRIGMAQELLSQLWTTAKTGL